MKTRLRVRTDGSEDDWLSGWWGIFSASPEQGSSGFATFYPSQDAVIAPVDYAYAVICVGDTYIMFESEYEYLKFVEWLNLLQIRRGLRLDEVGRVNRT